MISTIPVSPTTHSLSFQTTSEPDSKFAPIVVSGALFVGKAIVGGAIGTAASSILVSLLPKNNAFLRSF